MPCFYSNLCVLSDLDGLVVWVYVWLFVNYVALTGGCLVCWSWFIVACYILCVKIFASLHVTWLLSLCWLCLSAVALVFSAIVDDFV